MFTKQYVFYTYYLSLPKDLNIVIVIIIVMETTIAIKESTAQLLAQLKRRMNAKNMDEALREIIRKSENIKKSRFGSQPNLKEFKEEERAQFHGV